MKVEEQNLYLICSYDWSIADRFEETMNEVETNSKFQQIFNPIHGRL